MALNGTPKKVDNWLTRHQVALLRIWVVVFTVFTIFLFSQGRSRDSKISNQAKQNRNLIAEIQRSRIQSCKANYDTILHAFDPFIPKADDPRTPRNEVEDFKLFRDSLIDKRSHCKEQVAVKPKERNAKP